MSLATQVSTAIFKTPKITFTAPRPRLCKVAGMCSFSMKAAPLLFNQHLQQQLINASIAGRNWKRQSAVWTCRIREYSPFWIQGLQAEQTDALALTFQLSRLFPAIRKKLLVARILPYECKFGPVLCKPTPTFPPVVDHGAVNIAAVPTLQALQSRSSEFVLKMLTTISEEIPFCKEEVEAASKYLNSRFNALNARIKSITSIQDTNPSRWPFHHFLFHCEKKQRPLTIEMTQEETRASNIRGSHYAGNVACEQLRSTL